MGQRLDDLTCTRHLCLAQNVIEMRSAENLVSDRDTQDGVKTNSDCPVSTSVSIPKEANSRMNQHIVEVADTD